MQEEKIKELDALFSKYGVKSKTKVELAKTFLKIQSYKVELNLGKVIYRDQLIKNNGNGCACVIVPMTDDGKVIMVVQPRVFSKKGVLLDFPAGYIEEGEDILEAASRELEEETGYVAREMKLIASYYQDEGISDARVHVVLAKGIEKVKELHLDKDEFLEPVVVDFADLDELVEREYIQAGGSQLAIAKVKLLERSKTL